MFLLLFEGGFETVHSGIAVEEDRADDVGDGVLVGVNSTTACMASLETHFTPC